MGAFVGSGRKGPAGEVVPKGNQSSIEEGRVEVAR